MCLNFNSIIVRITEENGGEREEKRMNEKTNQWTDLGCLQARAREREELTTALILIWLNVRICTDNVQRERERGANQCTRGEGYCAVVYT